MNGKCTSIKIVSALKKKTPQLCNCFIYIFFASYFTTCIWNLQLHVQAWYIYIDGKFVKIYTEEVEYFNNIKT